jgi:hypothetical protein
MSRLPGRMMDPPPTFLSGQVLIVVDRKIRKQLAYHKIRLSSTMFMREVNTRSVPCTVHEDNVQDFFFRRQGSTVTRIL